VKGKEYNLGKAPASQFYWGDWLNDVELQSACSASRGIWANALARMWYAKIRGELTATIEKYPSILNCTIEEFNVFLCEAETLLFCYLSRNGNGTVTLRNRRMYREDKERENSRLRQQRYKEKHGSNATSNGQVTHPSSSSSSSSLKKIYKRKVLLPKDYKLTEEHIKYAEFKGIAQGIPDIFEAFCLHHRKKGSQFVDWNAAWQTWIRKKIEFDKDKGYIAQAQEPDLNAQKERDEYLAQFTPEQRAENMEKLKKIAMGIVKK